MAACVETTLNIWELWVFMASAEIKHVGISQSRTSKKSIVMELKVRYCIVTNSLVLIILKWNPALLVTSDWTTQFITTITAISHTMTSYLRMPVIMKSIPFDFLSPCNTCFVINIYQTTWPIDSPQNILLHKSILENSPLVTKMCLFLSTYSNNWQQSQNWGEQKKLERNRLITQ